VAFFIFGFFFVSAFRPPVFFGLFLIGHSDRVSERSLFRIALCLFLSVPVDFPPCCFSLSFCCLWSHGTVSCRKLLLTIFIVTFPRSLHHFSVGRPPSFFGRSRLAAAVPWSRGWLFPSPFHCRYLAPSPFIFDSWSLHFVHRPQLGADAISCRPHVRLQ